MRRYRLTVLPLLAAGMLSCGSDDAGAGGAPGTGGSNPNRMIALLEAGQPVLGLTSGEMSREGGTRMGLQQGLDYIWYSLETGPFDMETLGAYMGGVAETAGGDAPPPMMLRVPPIRLGRQQALAHVGLGLATGVRAIAFPHVETPDEVTFAASLIGDRLWPLNPDGDVLMMVMIEDRGAVESVRDIVRTPGIGVVFPGPADLRNVYEGDEDAVEAAIQAILAACLEFDVACAMTATADDIAMRLAQGFRFMVLSTPEALAAGRAVSGRMN